MKRNKKQLSPKESQEQDDTKVTGDVTLSSHLVRRCSGQWVSHKTRVGVVLYPTQQISHE